MNDIEPQEPAGRSRTANFAALWGLTGGQRLRYASAIVATGCASVFMLTVPLVGGFVLDVVEAQDLARGAEVLVEMTASLSARTGGEPYVVYLVISALAGIALTACGALCQFLQGRWAAIASEALAQRVREAMYDRLQHLPASFFDESDTGDLVQRCSSDVETVRVFLSSQVVQVGRSILLISVLVPILFARDARLAGLSLLLMPFIVAGAYYFFYKVRQQFKITDESEGAMTARLQENLTGIRVVRAFARQDYEVDHFAAKSLALRDNRERLSRLNGLYWAVSDFLCTAQVCIVLIAGGVFLADGSLSVGEFFAFMMQVTMVIWPIRHLGQVLNESGKAMVSLGRINHVLNAEEESRDPAPAIARARGELVVENLLVEYEPGRPVLQDFSVHIPPGETIGIVGPPGSGKSTLIRVLVRLYEAKAGRVLIDGLDIGQVDRHWLRRQFGIVMQSPFLYSRTVADNLRVARADVDEDAMTAAAREAAVHDAIVGFPAGYRSRVGERGVTLSGGQRQRLALARALLVEPPILVLDDALSAVDTGTEQEIKAALLRRRGRHTTIIIAHRLSSVRDADRILVLERGRLIQEGSHATLASAPGPYRRLCEIQGALDVAIERDLRDADRTRDEVSMPFDEDEQFDDSVGEDATHGVQLALWRRLFGYSFGYRRELVFLIVAAVATAAVEVTFSLFAKWVVDDVQENGTAASFGLWAGLYMLCNLVVAVAVGGFEWIAGRVSCYVSHDIRFDAFNNLQRLSFAYYDRRPVGWLMARLTADCDRLTSILSWGFVDLVWCAAIMLGFTAAMLVMEWRLALIAMAVLPVVCWVSVKFHRRLLDSARLVRSTNSEITGSFNESIMGVLTSKTFVSQDDNAKQFGTLTARMYRTSVRNFVLAAVYLPLVLVLAAVAVNVTLTVGGAFVYLGIIGAGTAVAFTMLARNFFWPAEMMSTWFVELQMAQAAAERVLSVIDAEPDIQDSASVLQALAVGRESSTARLGRFAADGGRERIERIELQGVGFAYDPDQPVLKNIDLVAERGETIAIVGPTGGGKSTLVNVICRFYEPTAGQVLIDGTDYRNRSLNWLQSNLGMVLQDAHVFSGSIRENIRYGRLDATDAQVEHAARLADAHDFIAALDKGYDTPAGEGGSRLSAGQKQLVSLARAILADPQILVMDEATSSVDTETELAIQHALAEIFKGRISFVIAHRLSTIRNATRILVIDDGRIVEAGDHGTLMAENGRYASLYRQQGLNEATREWGEGAEPAQGGIVAG